LVQIREKARAHLRAGGAESRLPHANQLWMLVGFALFERLRPHWECLEVFPQAIVCVLGAGATHKSKPGGVLTQLAAVARLTGWPSPPAESSLRTVAHGPTHDGLDAYLAAWVAGLRPEQRSALGAPPDDVIWIPSLALVSNTRLHPAAARAVHSAVHRPRMPVSGETRRIRRGHRSAKEDEGNMHDRS
jgi:hypothetical protein